MLVEEFSENCKYNKIWNSVDLAFVQKFKSEELMAQKKIRTEVIQLEDALSQVRKEYEMLRIEFEQNLAANEQTGKEQRGTNLRVTAFYGCYNI